MLNLVIIFMSIVLVNNFLLSQFLGICSFLGVSNKMESAVGMSGAVIFVMVIAEITTWPIQQVLNKLDIAYLQTVVFILVIAARYLPPTDHNKLRYPRCDNQRYQLQLYIHSGYRLCSWSWSRLRCCDGTVCRCS